MPAHTGMRARAAVGGGGRPVPGLGLGSGSGLGLVLFESGPKGPLPPTVAKQLDCQRVRPFVWVRTYWALLEGYIKGSSSQLTDTPITTPRKNTSLLSL